MRIGMVLANHTYPPDIRVDKEADALAPGHECLLLCKAGPGQAAVEKAGPVTAVRHAVYPGSAWKRRLDSLMFLLTLDSPSWRGAMERLVTEHGAQALHVHDLPYVRSAFKAGRATGVPVVLDLHENYPAALRLWRRRPIDKLFFPASRAERLERWAAKRVDRIVVVVDEARDRLTSLGADPARITVFGNTEPRALAEPEPPALDAGRLELVYVGGVAAHRGLDTTVEAMPAILASRPDARLTIVGDGDTLAETKALAAAFKLGDAVEFTGWLSKAEAMTYIERATVALVPHHRSPHTDATVPHKLFQYMALGRPVLVSDCAPLARIVRETACGDVFASGDAADLAVKALSLADPDRARACGAAGREAVLDRYNLEAEAPIISGLYDSLPG